MRRWLEWKDKKSHTDAVNFVSALPAEWRKVGEGAVFSRKSHGFCLHRDHGASCTWMLMIFVRDAGKGCERKAQNGAK